MPAPFRKCVWVKGALPVSDELDGNHDRHDQHHAHPHIRATSLRASAPIAVVYVAVVVRLACPSTAATSGSGTPAATAADPVGVAKAFRRGLRPLNAGCDHQLGDVSAVALSSAARARDRT